MGDGGALSGLRFGILTCSTSRTPADDGSGDALAEGVQAQGGVVAQRALLPDDREAIAALLRTWADGGRLDVILTTGGTGLGPHDVTPEATAAVAERDVPGLAELLRADGRQATPYAVLSRGRAALRGPTLIVNLPGSPAGARSGLLVLQPILGHAVAIARGGGHGDGGGRG